MAAGYRWARHHDPGSIEAAVGFTLEAQEAQDIHAIRDLLTRALAPEK